MILSMTLPIFSEKERILYERSKLLDRRALLYDCFFLPLRKSRIVEIKLIDKQIDFLEEHLVALQKEERKNMLTQTNKVLSETDALIQ